MSTFPSRLLLLALCVLPALGAGFRTGHRAVVASFMYSCDASDPRPRLRTTYTAAGKPKARPDSASVAVFHHGDAPDRKYAEVGEVNVLASGSHTSVDDLTEWACRGARRLGGDAIVDVEWDDAAHVKPPAGSVGRLYLTATVVRWD